MNTQNPPPAPANRTRRHLLGAAAGTALAAAVPFAARAQTTPKRIRLAHTAPLLHGWHLWSEQFKKGIEAKTGGKIQVQIFPNAQMGNERDTAQAVRSGALEMGALGVGLSSWVPELSITDAPFLWKSRAQAYAAFGGGFGAEMAKRCMDKGFVLTGWTDLGFRCITNNKRAVTSAKDLQDMKMRVPVSKSYIAMMQAMGASTVAVDLSELYLALRQGVADGQDTPPSVVKSNKYYEVQKFVSKTDHVLTTGYTIANPKFFASLNADEKTAFLAAATEADTWLREYTQKDELEAYDFLKSQGMQVTLDLDVESFRKACAPVIAKLPELFPPDLVKMAQATTV